MDFLFEGTRTVIWQQLVMYVVGIILIRLAINKKYEPSLLLPVGFGATMVNPPTSGVLGQFVQGKVPTAGVTQWFYKVGIESPETVPLLLFTGIGAMTDFELPLSQPFYFLFGVTAQFGIFAVIFVAALLGFDLEDTASIGIIGAADGLTSILASQVLNSAYIGPITVAAYFYMALMPIIQPFAIKLVTTKKERRICMSYNVKAIPKFTRVAFPTAATMIVGFIFPQSVALIGFLMFGNLLRERGVLNTFSQTAQDQLVNPIILPLGIMASFNMRAEQFVNLQTLMILAFGLVASIFDTMAGVFFAKLVNVVLATLHKPPINPMVGGCGTSAFPMSSRIVQKLANEEQKGNIILMQTAGTNVAGQVTSVITGGLVISTVPQYL